MITSVSNKKIKDIQKLKENKNIWKIFDRRKTSSRRSYAGECS